MLLSKLRLKGFLKFSLSHHPLCWQYRNHTIRIRGFSFCLGCTAFYFGFFIGFLLIIFIHLNRFNWEELVIIAIILYLPTIFRLFRFPIFNTTQKGLRFLYRFFLGVGVVVGLISIFKASNIFIGLLQFLLGIGLYAGIGLKRVFGKNVMDECNDCSFSPSWECPGFSPFHIKPR